MLAGIELVRAAHPTIGLIAIFIGAHGAPYILVCTHGAANGCFRYEEAWMPEYRRSFVPGGTYFFTLVSYQRQKILCDNVVRHA